MLGRTYFAMRNPAKAEAALARAYELLPTDTGVLLAYAEAFAANHDNSLEGRPSELIAEALKLDPTDVTARWLSGMAAFQRGQFAASVVAWKGVLAEIDPNSEDAAELRQLIDNAEQRAGVPTQARLAAQSSATPNATGLSAAVGTRPRSHPQPAPLSSLRPHREANRRRRIKLRPVPPRSTWRCLWRQTWRSERHRKRRCSSMPRRRPDHRCRWRCNASPSPTSPRRLRLDDSMAMMPAMKLSSFPEVIVGARVSASGQAMPQSGDLEGETGPIPKHSADQVSITIDRVRP
jgi:cytochrome c-type biogenesis protein CcmH